MAAIAYEGSSQIFLPRTAWEVLPKMAYTGRLRPKGVPFSSFRYIKGKGFHKLRYIKGQGNRSFKYLKGP